MSGIRPTTRRAARLLSITLAMRASDGRAQANPADDREAVRAVVHAIIGADNARDLGRVLAQYEPDAVLLPPGAPPVVGREAIRPRYASLFAAMQPRLTTTIDDVRVQGALAVVRGHNGGVMQPLDRDSASRVVNDVYVMVLTRGAERRWRIAQLIWHSPTR